MIGFVAPFRILDHLNRLNIVKETSREYHCTCPVCGDGGFKVNKKDGKYQAFKCGCEVKDIREAIRPWSEVKGQGTKEKRYKGNKQVNGSIKLARLDAPAIDAPVSELKLIPDWQQKQGIPVQAVETRYWYSKTQWVSRFEWQTPEGKEKTIRQGHIKSNGLIQWTKGSKDWFAYKLSEAVKHCHGKWVLSVEGEGCVETTRAIAFSFQFDPCHVIEDKAIANDVTKLKEGGTLQKDYSHYSTAF